MSAARWNESEGVTMDDHEHCVRGLAYNLWEAAGRPHGRAEEFWYTAEATFAAAARTAATQVAEPAPPARPAGLAARLGLALRPGRKKSLRRKFKPKA
jgi:hypothetical protein